MIPFFQKKAVSSGTSAASPKTEGKPRKSGFKALIRALLLLGLAGIVVGFFAFAALAAWVSRSLPDPNVLSTREVPQSTKIFDRTGTTLLYEIHGDEKRTLIKIDDLPSYVKHATVAIEDRGFYEHHGIYWKGLIRAVGMSVLKGQKVQGTSTLTQQLVKNAILSNERTLTRKLKEFILSLQIERIYTKDQILQLYLNEIPYGSTIYGVESAAQSYFGKPAKDLSIDEAALLASIPQAPDFYSPYGTGSRGDNRDRLIKRQRYVIDQMAEQGYIKKEEADSAKAVDVLAKIKPHTMGDILAPHFVMYVKSLLSDKYGVKVVEQGGLKVTTTLDWDKQKIAEEEVKKGVDANGAKFKFTNAALVALDPKTGQVISMVGSKDFFDVENDGQVNVTLRPRQPGSSFKPIVYAAGFMRGYLPETQLWDVTTVFKTDLKDYIPKNYGKNEEHGPISIRQALQGSLNIPAVKMMYLVGVARVIDFAETLGYTTFGDRTRFGLALVLGGGEVKPIEHAAAFGSIANDGILMPTSAILKVEEANGTVLEEWKQPEGTRVMESQIASLTSDVLSDNNARAYVFGTRSPLTLPDRPVAAKTGTTSNFHDAWTVGYTPNLVSVVWVGNNNNKEMSEGADGSKIAAPIWQGYMKRATKGMPVENFKKPTPPTTDKLALLGKAFEQKAKVDIVSGKLATANTPADLIEERTFFQPHSILFFVDKDDPTGPPPTNPNTDPQFATWEEGVRKWVEKSKWNATGTSGIIPTEYDDVHNVDVQPKVTITSPQENTIFETRLFNVQAVVESTRSIVRLEVFVDGKPVGVVNAMPYNFWVTLPAEVESGFHELTVTAFDDVRNRGSATINFTLSEAPPVVETPPVTTNPY